MVCNSSIFRQRDCCPWDRQLGRAAHRGRGLCIGTAHPSSVGLGRRRCPEGPLGCGGAFRLVSSGMGGQDTEKNRDTHVNVELTMRA